MNKKLNKTPWIVSDNDKFIGAVYTTKRGNELVIKKDSTPAEIIAWVAMVALDNWSLSLSGGKENNQVLIDSKINLYRKLAEEHLKISPILKSHLKDLNDKINDTVKERRGLEKGSSVDYWLALRINEQVYFKEKLETLLKRLAKKTTPVGHITDADIEKARDYPIDMLLDFNRAGFCNCIFHIEETGSLKYKKDLNYVHCFGGCAKTYDSISVYMKLYNVSFIEAVRSLSNKN
mgnify:CR=1 FL=1|tara:strand:+ start:290 stop:991 length:702 start_codon:yes stop_codon:yes gene_type:complete